MTFSIQECSPELLFSINYDALTYQVGKDGPKVEIIALVDVSSASEFDQRNITEFGIRFYGRTSAGSLPDDAEGIAEAFRIAGKVAKKLRFAFVGKPLRNLLNHNSILAHDLQTAAK